MKRANVGGGRQRRRSRVLRTSSRPALPPRFLQRGPSGRCLVGSQTPFYEVFAGKCTTLDYIPILYEHDQLTTVVTVSDWDLVRNDPAAGSPELFDVVFSISSFEHDGLGRYGDPLNPEGDL